MTDKEYKRLIEAIDSYGAKSSGSEAKARAALRSIGVLDEHGNLTPPFRPESNGNSDGNRIVTI